MSTMSWKEWQGIKAEREAARVALWSRVAIAATAWATCAALWVPILWH
jgi:hypothetical protein